MTIYDLEVGKTYFLTNPNYRDYFFLVPKYIKPPRLYCEALYFFEDSDVLVWDKNAQLENDDLETYSLKNTSAIEKVDSASMRNLIPFIFSASISVHDR